MPPKEGYQVRVLSSQLTGTFMTGAPLRLPVIHIFHRVVGSLRPFMGTSTSSNVERQGCSGVLIEAEDDDPGIRGLSSSPNFPKHRIESQYKTKPLNDPLEAAIIDQSRVTSGSAALKLDQFVLGKTSVASDIARGSLSTTGSAVSSLKGVASLNELRAHISSRSPQALAIPYADENSSGSPGTLTWSSSSPASSTSFSSKESVEESPKYLSDDVYHLPIKRMIKQVCVAGLEPRGKSNRKFCLSADEIRDICKLSQGVFLDESALLRLEAPVKIVGDIHGQFRDLMRLFKKGGMPPAQHYLFLGDYVDRGKQSLETFMLLLLLKLRYPSHIHLLRGNHECAGVTKVYGFYDECKRRSSLKAWRSIVDVFNSLPVAALVGGRIFCVHGGISPSLNSMSQIEAIARPTDVPESGILADLLWSDPDPQVKEWSENDRGVSFCFGQRSLERFCKHHNFDLVVRGHMVVEDGYEFFGGRRLVTVFSAPDYCGDFNNYGAMMSVSEGLECSFDTIEPKAKEVRTTSPPNRLEVESPRREKNRRQAFQKRESKTVLA